MTHGVPLRLQMPWQPGKGGAGRGGHMFCTMMPDQAMLQPQTQTQTQMLQVIHPFLGRSD